MKVVVPITALTSGELGPKMAGRYDTEVYAKGVSRMENFLPFSQGGATLRPGTKYVGVPIANAATRLMAFVVTEYGSTKSYILELSNYSLRIWRQADNTVLASQTFSTPWVTAELFRIQVCQIGNSLVFVNRNYVPKILTWTSGDAFTGAGGALPDFQFSGPGQTFGQSVASWGANTFYASGAIIQAASSYWYATVGGTSGASAPSWNVAATEAAPVTDNSARWRFLQEVPFSSAGNYPGAVAHYLGRLWFASTATKPSGIWASQTNNLGNFFYFDVISFTNRQLKDPKAWYAAFDGTVGSTQITTTNSGTFPSDYLSSGVSYYAKRAGSFRSYTVGSWGAGATRYVDITPAIDADDAGNGKYWTFSTWKDPLGAGEYETVTIRKDVTSDDSSFMFELDSDSNEAIQWIATGKNLAAGTITGEWMVPADITALSIRAELQTRKGSANFIQGIMIGDSVVFAQVGGKKIREFQFSNDRQGYQSQDLALMADHILRSGIVEFEFTQVPEPMVWVVRSDGVVACLVLNQQSSVFAWSRITMPSGLVKSLAVVPNPTTGEDDVYAVVLRGATYQIELFAQAFSGYHVDGGQIVSSAGSTVSGLFRFGSSVDVVDLTSGVVYAAQTLAAGVLTVPGVAVGHQIAIGILFSAFLETMSLGPTIQGGTMQSSLRRVLGAIFRVLGSWQFYAGLGTTEPVVMPDTSAAYSGDVKVPLPSEWGRDGILKVKAMGTAATIIGIMAEVEAT